MMDKLANLEDILNIQQYILHVKPDIAMRAIGIYLTYFIEKHVRVPQTNKIMSNIRIPIQPAHQFNLFCNYMYIYIYIYPVIYITIYNMMYIRTHMCLCEQSQQSLMIKRAITIRDLP